MKKKLNLNKKFAIISLSLLVALFVVMLVAVQVIAQVSTNNYLQNDVLITHHALNSEVTDVLDEVNFGYTRLMQGNLSQLTLGSHEQKQHAFETLVQRSALSDDYVNVALCLDDETFVTNTEVNLPTKSFGKMVTEGSAILYLGEVNSEMGYVQLGRKFQSVMDKINGYVVFYVDVSVFNGFCAQTESGVGYTQILTENYKILAKSDGKNVGQTVTEQSKYALRNEVFSSVIDGQKSLVAVTKLSNQYNLDWFFVSVLDMGVLQKDFVVLSWALVAIALVCGVSILFLAIKTARSTTAPINKLSQNISSVDFSLHQSLQIGAEGDELFELERNYEEMLQRLYKLMDENKQNMETQRKLEMDALQMQINPHFLYNTLDAIAWMAKIKKQSEIEKLTINLAKFFRISLHKGDKFVKIKEETELISHFLEIEKIRFPDTINYVCDILETIGEYKTLKLILQPIVENSIKHGFSEKEGVGTISISAIAEEDDIVISVTDDGCGFDVTPNFWTEKNNKPNGYGLYNVNERIRLEYGEGYGISITSQKGVGTTVKVRIKKRL